MYILHILYENSQYSCNDDCSPYHPLRNLIYLSPSVALCQIVFNPRALPRRKTRAIQVTNYYQPRDANMHFLQRTPREAIYDKILKIFFFFFFEICITLESILNAPRSISND